MSKWDRLGYFVAISILALPNANHGFVHDAIFHAGDVLAAAMFGWLLRRAATPKEAGLQST